ncbi:hypothetical protein AWM70_02980 [Paenibacillus yonginensis]|uniref:Aminotransferase class I/classII domain-containing protein n=1 Tax=Paenibacillus yonginensis TaxID=1462996 RepID=A0A1B1MWW3_9BACL|nr:hypothetical protein [Paenibacillus yonginensis]ANS73670.1 hypothetical protein AWM70_02980 [Paenibacillus yonginensis]
MVERLDGELANWKAHIRKLEEEEGLINLAWDQLGDSLIENRMAEAEEQAEQTCGEETCGEEAGLEAAERAVRSWMQQDDTCPIEGEGEGPAEAEPKQTETLRQACAERRELALSKLAGPSWHGTVLIAAGRRHIWLRLPKGLGSTALLRAALLEGAAFLPGPLAFAEPTAGSERLIRLSYTGCGIAQLAEGLDRVAAALGAFTARLDQGRS